MRAPDQIKPKGSGDYLEVMSKVVFQSGMSYKIVNQNDRASETGSTGSTLPKSLACPPEIDLLTQDAKVIRNRRKLEAVVSNAQKLLELDSEFSGFQKYLRSHDDFPALVKDLRKQFKFLGEMGCYYYLYVLGEKVPLHEEWQASLKK